MKYLRLFLLILIAYVVFAGFNTVITELKKEPPTYCMVELTNRIAGFQPCDLIDADQGSAV